MVDDHQECRGIEVGVHEYLPAPTYVIWLVGTVSLLHPFTILCLFQVSHLQCMHLNVLHRYQLNIITSLEIFDTTTSLIDTSLFLHFVHKKRGHGQSDFSWTVVALYSYVPLMSVFLCIITSELCRLPYCSSTIKKIDSNGVNPEYSITERGWFGIRSQIICIVSRVSGKGWNDSESMFWNEFSIIMIY